MNNKKIIGQPPKNKLFSRLFLGDEKYVFLENVSSLLAAGIPIVEAAKAVSVEVVSKRLKKIILQLIEDIEDGKSLSVALENTYLYSPHVASLIRAGESSGRLAENLKIISVEQAKERLLRSKIRSATMYPVFVFGLTIIIGISIAWFILPKLANVFSQLKVKLPMITDVLIKTGLFLSHYGNVVVPLFILLLTIIFYFIFLYPKSRIVGEYLIFSFPGVKDMMRQSELSRFGYLLGSLLSAGLPPNEALESLSQATNMSRYQKFYTYLKDSVIEGNSFKKSFSNWSGINRIIPVPVQQLVIAGEQSGSLPETLLRIGQDYEAKTDATAKDLAIIIEPILLVFVWLGVVGVALAVILPIYSLVGNMQAY